MPIWKRNIPLGPVAAADAEAMARNMGKLVGLRLTEVGDDYLRAQLPVDERTRQPFGLLHGGASCVLAEELGSVAANLCLPDDGSFAVGLEINANHLRSVTDGFVIGTARPIHVGRSTQVWDIRIEDEAGRAVCVSRLTVAVRSGGRPG